MLLSIIYQNYHIDKLSRKAVYVEHENKMELVLNTLSVYFAQNVKYMARRMYNCRSTDN